MEMLRQLYWCGLHLWLQIIGDENVQVFFIFYAMTWRDCNREEKSTFLCWHVVISPKAGLSEVLYTRQFSHRLWSLSISPAQCNHPPSPCFSLMIQSIFPTFCCPHFPRCLLSPLMFQSMNKWLLLFSLWVLGQHEPLCSLGRSRRWNSGDWQTALIQKAKRKEQNAFRRKIRSIWHNELSVSSWIHLHV